MLLLGSKKIGVSNFICYIIYLTNFNTKGIEDMTGLEYNISTEWSRDVYGQATGDTALEHVPARVQQLWEDFRHAHHLPNDAQIVEFDRILTDFQTNEWSA